MMDYLLKSDPILLFISDKRGFTPFQYSRKEHMEQWKEFLFKRKDYFLPCKELLKTQFLEQ